MSRCCLICGVTPTELASAALDAWPNAMLDELRCCTACAELFDNPALEAEPDEIPEPETEPCTTTSRAPSSAPATPRAV